MIFPPRSTMPHAALYVGGGAPPPSFHPSDLFSGDDGGLWIPAESDLFEERTGGSATTPSSTDGVVGTMEDLSGNATWAFAPADSARPLKKVDGGITSILLDGTDDVFNCPDTIDPTGITFAFGFKKNSDTQGAFAAAYDDGSFGTFTALYQDGSSSSSKVGASCTIDGSSFSGDRNAFHDALNDGAYHTIIFQNDATVFDIAQFGVGVNIFGDTDNGLYVGGNCTFAMAINRTLDSGELSDLATYIAGTYT